MESVGKVWCAMEEIPRASPGVRKDDGVADHELSNGPRPKRGWR